MFRCRFPSNSKQIPFPKKKDFVQVNMSIPDLAEDIVKTYTNDVIDDNARTIIIVGSTSAGKSNLLHDFLEKSEVPKETLVLEYSFGRKSQKQTIEKNICHVWEYGGRLEMLQNVLSSIPLQGRCYYCVLLDLSKIKTLWNTMEWCMKTMKDAYADLTVLPEIIIIGGKYDLFKNYDTEIKKHVCTTIRSFALVYNANILFYSSKEAQLVRKAKDILRDIGFGSGVAFKEKNINYNKPLLIAKGSDTWESLGLPPSTIEQIRDRHYTRIVPETEVKQEVKSLPRSHPEPILDSLASLKYEELRSMETYDPCIGDYLLLLQ